MSDPLTPEAKSAVMQLMGQTYGQMKKQDGMIVGSSAQLQGKSDEMKRLVEQLVATPTVANQHRPQPQGPPPQQAPQAAPVPTGPPAGTITPEQAMAELQVAPAPAQLQASLDETFEDQINQTMEFDFSEPSAIDKLVELQKETNLLLKDIKLQLESTNVKPTRKKAKSKVA
jgi:hypothetical protein